MTETMQRQELASFLRSKREATDPVTVGLQPGPRRRTPGLRREEVAQLSGVSATWYTWLEQSRDIGVSRQVIDSLARALRLEPAERAHLYTLAGLARPADNPGLQQVDDTLRRLVATLQPNPAYVVNPWWDILAYNAAYATLIGGLDRLPAAERNSLWLTFTQGDKLLVDWPSETRQIVGQLRAHLAEFPHDQRGPELVETLSAASPKFAELWREHAVGSFRSSRKRFQHPSAGRLDLDYLKLASAGNDQQDLIVFLPADESSALLAAAPTGFEPVSPP